MKFQEQKVHDLMDAVTESMKMADSDKYFVAIYDGEVYEWGNNEETIQRMFRTCPERFTELVIESLAAKMEGLSDEAAQGDPFDPRSTEYWELGVSELELFMQGRDAQTQECIKTVQQALSVLNEQGLIDGEGNVIGRDLRRVLQRDMGLNELVNFENLDWYLEDACGNLLSEHLVTIGKSETNGRTRVYNFLNSPFKLY